MQIILRFSYTGVLLLGIIFFVLGIVIDSSPIEKYDISDNITGNLSGDWTVFRQ